jgi:hypothetical protein
VNPPVLSRAEFDQLLTEHSRLIELANELEYRLYLLGEHPSDSPIAQCQQAAGALIGSLRNVLFRHDQSVLPMLEGLIAQKQ